MKLRVGFVAPVAGFFEKGNTRTSCGSAKSLDHVTAITLHYKPNKQLGKCDKSPGNYPLRFSICKDARG